MTNKEIIDKIISTFEQEGLHITNITYPDGYFIFENKEEYAMMHFEVKECKNWLFGCWLTHIDDGVQVELFNQHKRYLDKFKPSRGTYTCTCKIQTLDNINADTLFNMIRACNFIKHNPYVAAMRDFQWKDYNYNRQEPLKAFVRYWVGGFKKWRTKKVNDWMTKQLFKELEKVGREEFADYDWKINDDGENCTPRYDLMVKLADDDEQETGCYELFDNDEDRQRWTRKQKRIKQIGKFLGSEYYFSEVNDCVTFWKECEWKEYMLKSEEIDYGN